MTGYHGPDGYEHKPLDDRDERDEHGRPVERIDEELSEMCGHSDNYDPLGGTKAGDY
jgi:hypothetical protein